MKFGEKFLKRKNRKNLACKEIVVSIDVLKDALMSYYTPLNVCQPDIEDIEIIGVKSITLKLYERTV